MLPKKIFKAYDIRGVYPNEINENIVAEICAKLAKKFFKRGLIVVGHDARLSSPALYKAVKKTLVVSSGKLIVIDAGLITTPMMYFLVNKLKASGGIMVTASHNPKEYNGLKVVGQKAIAVSGLEVYKLAGL